jgi:hypothetical protein
MSDTRTTYLHCIFLGYRDVSYVPYGTSHSYLCVSIVNTLAARRRANSAAVCDVELPEIIHSLARDYYGS